jgi:fibro-slime domain-containing protein
MLFSRDLQGTMPLSHRDSAFAGPVIPRRAGALVTALLLLCACDGSLGDDTSGSGASGTGASGSGSSSGAGGEGGLGLSSGAGSGSSGAGGSACGSVLAGTVRDFMIAHPDFEGTLGVDPGIVLPDLGADGKPVYAHGTQGTLTTTGQQNFDQWYRDVAGVNIALPLSITLVAAGGGVYTYDNSSFFPINDQGFGNEGNVFNYHFTLELRTQFEYKGGEVFTFTGDDDLFTYINGRLVIDLGGVHGAMSQTVDLDAVASQIGITVGNTYPLDFFFAERHTSESNFRIDTTIDCFNPPPE